MAGFFPSNETFPSNELYPGLDNSVEPGPGGKVVRWLNSRVLPHKKHRTSRGYWSRCTPAP